jgi:hypothetical protein
MFLMQESRREPGHVPGLRFLASASAMAQQFG